MSRLSLLTPLSRERALLIKSDWRGCVRELDRACLCTRELASAYGSNWSLNIRTVGHINLRVLPTPNMAHNDSTKLIMGRESEIIWIMYRHRQTYNKLMDIKKTLNQPLTSDVPPEKKNKPSGSINSFTQSTFPSEKPIWEAASIPLRLRQKLANLKTRVRVCVFWKRGFKSTLIMNEWMNSRGSSNALP